MFINKKLDTDTQFSKIKSSKTGKVKTTNRNQERKQNARKARKEKRGQIGLNLNSLNKGK